MKCGPLVATATLFLLTASANTDPPKAKEDRPKPLLTLREHAYQVVRVEFSPDGSRLATAHGDGIMKVWPVRQLLGQRVDR